MSSPERRAFTGSRSDGAEGEGRRILSVRKIPYAVAGSEMQRLMCRDQRGSLGSKSSRKLTAHEETETSVLQPQETKLPATRMNLEADSSRDPLIRAQPTDVLVSAV